MHGLPDTDKLVAYRTSPSAFLNKSNFIDLLQDKRVWGTASGKQKRITLLDGWHAHRAATDELLRELHTEIEILPANSTHLTQPCDALIFKSLKRHWVRYWEEYKLSAIAQGLVEPKSQKIKRPNRDW